MLSFPLHRSFVALPLEGEAQESFRMLQERLTPFAEFLRFQNSEQPHLTLHFWEILLEIEYTRLLQQLPAIVVRTSPFTVHVTDVATFGERGQDCVLFLTIAFSPELAALKKLCPWPRLRSPSASYGGQATSSFHPHITLARVSHPQRFARWKKRVMKEIEGASFPITVDRLRLYAEIGRVRQTPVEDFMFGAILPG